LYHKRILFLLIINFLIGQDTTMTENKTSEALIDTNKSFDSSILDTNLIPIPSLRDDKDTLNVLPVGKPFFNYDGED
jgi:hypothetical protein